MFLGCVETVAGSPFKDRNDMRFAGLCPRSGLGRKLNPARERARIVDHARQGETRRQAEALNHGVCARDGELNAGSRFCQVSQGLLRAQRLQPDEIANNSCNPCSFGRTARRPFNPNKHGCLARKQISTYRQADKESLIW